jgi:Fe-S-cluster containining protein
VPRIAIHTYQDPLSWIWTQAAQRIGLTVSRTTQAYAATDGAGTLALGNAEQLDDDDSLAQMIFHELCHSLVEGRGAFRKADWGLDNTLSYNAPGMAVSVATDHDWREHAALRTQFVLCQRYGLSALFAPTTDFREFWDGLNDTVVDDRSLLSVRSAIVALHRSTTEPWSHALHGALRSTASIAQAASTWASPTSPSLWALQAMSAGAPKHESGLPGRHSTSGTRTTSCGTCAWRYTSRGVQRCRQLDSEHKRETGTANSTELGRSVQEQWPGCHRYEPTLDCLTCGACCREAYHSVQVAARDTFAAAHPDLLVNNADYREVKRVPTFAVAVPDDDQPTATRCAALAGGELIQLGKSPAFATYRCTVYQDRPRSCREFTMGSAHCLEARQRVGMSV